MESEPLQRQDRCCPFPAKRYSFSLGSNRITADECAAEVQPQYFAKAVSEDVCLLKRSSVAVVPTGKRQQSWPIDELTPVSRED
ncbi:MAG: hypothetical protein ABEI52_06990, partial [Halobacteriaceae archaeon]